MVAATDVVLPEQGKATALGNGREVARGLDGLAVGIELVAPAAEGTAGAVDGTEVAKVAFQQQHLPCGQVVERPAPAHDMS